MSRVIGRVGRAVRLPAHPLQLWRSHHRLAIGLLAAGALVIAAALVAYEELKRPPDIHNEAAIRQFEPEPPKPVRGKPKLVNWPIFGLNPARTRYLPAKGVRPPFRLVWHYTERPLLEFPPVFADGRLYAVNNDGNAFALDAATGKVLWETRIGHLNASSLAYYKGRLYIVNLIPGHIVKLDAATGKVLWNHPLPGRAESSPLVLGASVYFGCENDCLYSLSTASGNIRWKTRLGGPVKAAPAYRDGVL
jgi:outer membrane protein assembly factor BamB